MIKPNLIFNNFKDAILTKYGPNPAKMLIYTGVLGWFVSSAAQVTAIAVNNKIPKEQKMFLIPQEIGDGAINVLSFFLVTSAIKNLASKLVSTGKLANPKIRKFLRDTGLNVKNGLGQTKFNIESMANFDLIKDDYKTFKNGCDVIAMTVGSILSCNIITPFLRNKFAADRQKKTISKNYNYAMQKLNPPKGISIDNYKKQASIKFSSPLKI